MPYIPMPKGRGFTAHSVMPIFTKQLQKVNYADPGEALRTMANHIKYLQEQLEYTLMNLDSSNVTEIETDVTNITSSSGSVSLGSGIALSGKNGESFTAGLAAGNAFAFSVKGKNGEQTMYLDSGGHLVITKNTTLSIDGGEW